MEVNWDAIGAVGEILGATVVFITLLYLARQIKQTNKIARFNTTKDLITAFDELNRLFLTDSSIRHVLSKDTELTFDESEQLYTYAIMYCNIFLSTQTAYDSGQIDEALYKAVCGDVEIAIERWPNLRGAFKRWVETYPAVSQYNIFLVLSKST